MTEETIPELVGKKLARAILDGEIRDAREGTRYAAEFIGVIMPEYDYVKIEHLCPLSLMVGAAAVYAELELMKGDHAT